jgi:hypothetical protein
MEVQPATLFSLLAHSVHAPCSKAQQNQGIWRQEDDRLLSAADSIYCVPTNRHFVSSGPAAR